MVYAAQLVATMGVPLPESGHKFGFPYIHVLRTNAHLNMQ